MISVQSLSKFFKQYKKQPGLLGSIKSLFKREYFTIKAVDNISFEVEEGEFVGFIGPNGAGKTTTLKCLSGLLFPTAGKVSVMGYTPFDRKKEFLKQISLVMGQKNQLWWDLPAMDSFLLNKEIYEVSKEQFDKVIDELVEMLDLKDVLNVQVRKLSLGQRMKCELVAALLHSPRVLFLDEPTIGLDVTMQKRLRDFFKEFNGKFKTTVILTSHYMDDVRELCKRVIIIDKGKIIYDGELDSIVKQYVKDKYITMRFLKEIDKVDVTKFGKLVKFEGDVATISVAREDVPNVSAKMLEELPVDDVDIKEMDLDDVVREIFEKNR
ncbi:ABC transporter ATP-binding protein [Candidatus Dojkabacteria bacterium]|nr:ABC transporter ATP-binding protein [Candidatus Dojkabacteria bacterium]